MTHMLSKAAIEALWRDYDVPVNENLEEIDDDFCGWERFTELDEIWRWFDGQYARWGGVHALMFPDEHQEALATDPSEYVVGTFEPYDVEERVEPEVLAYIEENGLMGAIVMRAVKYLRDAYDWDFGDTVCECLRSALLEEIGKEKMEELES